MYLPSVYHGVPNSFVFPEDFFFLFTFVLCLKFLVELQGVYPYSTFSLLMSWFSAVMTVSYKLRSQSSIIPLIYWLWLGFCFTVQSDMSFLPAIIACLVCSPLLMLRFIPAICPFLLCGTSLRSGCFSSLSLHLHYLAIK